MASALPLVAVTGAAGYVASHVVQLLSSCGYRVRGTVRDVTATAKVGHLSALPNVELFEADLVKEGSFDKAFAGVEYVHHCASPVLLTSDDPQNELVDPAVNGTLNVLRSALNSKSVKRVVITGSTAAIYTGKPHADPLHVYTESDWNMESSLTQDPYRYSKRLAEEAAWKFVKDHKDGLHFDVVVLNPCFILGPPLSTRSDSPSTALVKGLLDGQYKDGAISFCSGVVDVRDVAQAHLLAMKKAEAGGHRILLANPEGLSFLEIARILAVSDEFASYPLPTTEKAPVTFRPRLDNTKARTILGLQFTTPQTSILDMGRWLVQNGVVPKQ